MAWRVMSRIPAIRWSSSCDIAIFGSGAFYVYRCGVTRPDTSKEMSLRTEPGDTLVVPMIENWCRRTFGRTGRRSLGGSYAEFKQHSPGLFLRDIQISGARSTPFPSYSGLSFQLACSSILFTMEKSSYGISIVASRRSNAKLLHSLA